MKSPIRHIAIATISLSSFVSAEESNIRLSRPWRPDKGLIFGTDPVDSQRLSTLTSDAAAETVALGDMAISVIRPFNNSPVQLASEGQESEFHLDNRRTISEKKLERLRMTLKLRKDFNYEDVETGPAQFNWSHVGGEGDTWAADAALRADFWIPGFYNPDGAEMSIALGYDINRTQTAGDTVNLQSYHLAVPFVVKNIPFLKSSDQVFQADVSYNRDEVSDDDGFDFETNYKPVFQLPAGWIGTPCNLDGKALDTATTPVETYFSIDPKIGLSYGNKYALGSPTSTLDDGFAFSYGLTGKLGIPYTLGPLDNDPQLAEFAYSLKGGESLDGSGNFFYQEISLELKPELDSPLSLNIAYRNGSNGFGQDDFEEVAVALGVSF